MADEKQYQSLYRKYRPQGPQEVLGQEHVIRALMGAVREGRLAHAFLFCGPRGTGKTSTARILAKMVNCENGPTPEPCGTCEQCLRIREGQHLDVVEIDAASHGGVDDARDLREKAPTAPVQGREKVYIIDEAQRLSREAFDALLKVFEEPPPGVRFVLATTEPHKMPATIIGRTQRFDFRRIPPDTIADLLEHVAKGEGIQLTRDAALAIARHTEGSARDAESLLDQASVLGAGEIDETVIASLIGSGRTDVQHALADAVAIGDTRSVFELVARLVQEGQDVRHLTSQVLAHFRNLLVIRTAPGQHDLLDVTEDEAERLGAQAAKYSTAELSRVIALLLDAQTDMRWTTSPRLSLELALIRATIPETDDQPAGLLSRVERLERIAGVAAGVAAPGSGSAPRAPSGDASTPSSGAPQSPSAATPASNRGSQSRAGATSAPNARTAAKRVGEARGGEPVGAEGDSDVPPREVGATREREGGADLEPGAPAGEPGPGAATGEPAAVVQAVVGAGSPAVDVAMLRSSWGTLVQHLRSQGKAVLPSFLEVATPAAFDGETLELVFPPDRRFGVAKVEEREQELRDALRELFGVSPAIRCVVREAVAGGVDVDEDEPPPTDEEALARLTAELGARPAGEDGS